VLGEGAAVSRHAAAVGRALVAVAARPLLDVLRAFSRRARGPPQDR